jgi:hypothetical protein
VKRRPYHPDNNPATRAGKPGVDHPKYADLPARFPHPNAEPAAIHTSAVRAREPSFCV